MTVYTYEHAPYEGPGAVLDWAEERGHDVVRCDPVAGAVPIAGAGDLLVVMGGPASAAEQERYPWMAAEKAAILAAIDAGAGVVGICLGAQLAASALGATVTRNPEPEVGWWPVTPTAEGAADPVFATLPQPFTAGHFHSDTFGIPDGAVRTLESAGCPNQGFSAFGGRVVGLQCHLEWHADGVEALAEHFGHTLAPRGWVVDADTLVAGEATHGANNRYALFQILDAVTSVEA
jgi:GMP synthase-like glutamine amidotransferase